MFKSLSIALFLLPSVAFGDGIAKSLVAPYTDPCMERIFTKSQYEKQIEGDTFIINFKGDRVSLYDLYLLNRESFCGKIVKPKMTMAEMNFIFGKNQPKPLPQLATIPLPAPIWLLLMGLVSFFVIKFRKKQLLQVKSYK